MSKTIEDVLKDIYEEGRMYGAKGMGLWLSDAIKEALPEIEVVLRERVIGSNEGAVDNYYPTEEGKNLWRKEEEYKAVRNSLRNEQSKDLHKALYGKDA